MSIDLFYFFFHCYFFALQTSALTAFISQENEEAVFILKKLCEMCISTLHCLMFIAGCMIWQDQILQGGRVGIVKW